MYFSVGDVLRDATNGAVPHQSKSAYQYIFPRFPRDTSHMLESGKKKEFLPFMERIIGWLVNDLFLYDMGVQNSPQFLCDSEKQLC